MYKQPLLVDHLSDQSFRVVNQESDQIVVSTPRTSQSTGRLYIYIHT